MIALIKSFTKEKISLKNNRMLLKAYLILKSHFQDLYSKIKQKFFLESFEMF